MSLINFTQPAFLPTPLVRERFIETGLYEGDSMAVAAGLPFWSLDGIECSAAHAVHCTRRFDTDSRVTVHGGRSTWVLPHILYDVPTTFWLDAHYTGDPLRPELMDPRDGECPVIEEIRFIKQFGWTQKPVIMIDDLHMYEEAFWKSAEARHYNRAAWPTLNDLRQALVNYEFVTFKGVIYAF